MKKVNWVIFIPLGFLLKVFGIIKGQKNESKKIVKGPAITISNHTSFYDFMYTFNAIYPRRMHFLAAMKMFYENGLKQVLKLSKAIPKALLQSDAPATLKTFKVLKRGGIVSLFPEGQISMGGVFMKPSYSVAKLIKKAGVDVYFIKHHNAYMVNPPWTKKSFKGKIFTTIEKYPKLDIMADSVDVIYQKVIDHLHYDPFLYNQSKKERYRLNDIKGLEHIVYTCPKCLLETLVSNKHRLLCENCGHQMPFDRYGQLDQKGINHYLEISKDRLKACHEKDSNYTLTAKVQLEMIKDKKMRNVGSGRLTLNQTGYYYQGTISGESVSLQFHPKDISSLPSDIGRNIQIYSGYQIYQFVFKTSYLPTKFVFFGEYLHELEVKKHA
ncbi:MAG: lysophospholipid acyltransferase family protein [Acholeplasma sp.]|nr:lysophospholipid acyltransferase family protein [Acholeplasma sp.]